MTTKFLVVGSNCFTGSHIVNRLTNVPNSFVVGVSRSPEKSSLYLPYKGQHPRNFEFVQMDVVKNSEKLIHLIDQLRPNYVISVAALSEVFQSHLTPNEFFDINTTAVVRLANELRQRTFLHRYIHISSAEIYGNCDRPLVESAPFNPGTPYAASKAAADLYLMTSHKHFDFPMTLVRSTNVYGKHQQLYKIIPRVIISLRQGRSIELHGGGKVIRPFIHIKDVVQGIMKIIEHPNPGPVYHFSTDNNRNIAEVTRFVCERMDFEFEQVTIPVNQRPQQDQRYWLNSELAQRELGWRPLISFESGVDETIQWIDQNWNAVQNEPLKYIHQVEYAPSSKSPEHLLKAA